MSLHDRIKEARKNKGLTQEQLGELIGVAKTTITGYEKNREPTAAKVGEIADVLGVDVNFLFQDEVKTLQENHATLEEMENIVKRYRELDAHGKEMVDFTLQKEWERSTSESKAFNNIVEYPIPSHNDLSVKAAHNDYLDEPEELEKMNRDLDKLKRPD